MGNNRKNQRKESLIPKRSGSDLDSPVAVGISSRMVASAQLADFSMMSSMSPLLKPNRREEEEKSEESCNDPEFNNTSSVLLSINKYQVLNFTLSLIFSSSFF